MECATKVSQDIYQFMNEAGLKEAFLFGGAVIDPLINKDAKVNDYDVCVKTEEEFYRALEQLEKRGCNISEVMKTHNIYVVVRHAELGQIDFSCMNPENNGIFNIEKIYARFRENNGIYSNQVVDKYGAVDGLKQGKIRLSSDPVQEGPYNILRRFLAITGKYNFDISKDGINQEVVDQIKECFDSNSSYYVHQDRVRCLSRLPASLKRCKDRKEYVKNLGEQRLFANCFPEIDKLFNNEDFKNDERLTSCTTQKDLLKLMMMHVNGEDKDDMIDCLRILIKREAARQDKGVYEFVKGLGDEKTSTSRLDRFILSPLLQFKLEKAM